MARKLKITARAGPHERAPLRPMSLARAFSEEQLHAVLDGGLWPDGLELQDDQREWVENAIATHIDARTKDGPT